MRQQSAVPITSHMKLLISLPQHTHIHTHILTQPASPCHFPIVLILLGLRLGECYQGNLGLGPFRRQFSQCCLLLHPWFCAQQLQGTEDIPATIIPGPSSRNGLHHITCVVEMAIASLSSFPRPRLSTTFANNWISGRGWGSWGKVWVNSDRRQEDWLKMRSDLALPPPSPSSSHCKEGSNIL